MTQEKIPHHNPNQIKPTPSPPTNNIPNNSPALIPCNEDEIEPQPNEDDIQPAPAPQQLY
eukprot:1377246-Ditylum_brightwellii.AAC.1